jgi:streptogramin lyase
LVAIRPNGDVIRVVLPRANSAGRGGHVALGSGDVWVADGDSTLFRYRTRAARFASPIDVPNGFGVPEGRVATADGAVWVADPHGSELSRVDPRLHAVTASVSIGPDADVGGGVSGVAGGYGSVWAVAPNARKLWRIDLDTTTIAAVIELGDNPAAVAVGSGAVWVATSGGYVLRIDATSNRVAARIAVGGSPTALAAGDGLIWVAST